MGMILQFLYRVSASFRKNPKTPSKLFQAVHVDARHERRDTSGRDVDRVVGQLHDDSSRNDEPTSGRGAEAREAGTRTQEVGVAEGGGGAQAGDRTAGGLPSGGVGQRDRELAGEQGAVGFTQ